MNIIALLIGILLLIPLIALWMILLGQQSALVAAQDAIKSQVSSIDQLDQWIDSEGVEGVDIAGTTVDIQDDNTYNMLLVGLPLYSLLALYLISCWVPGGGVLKLLISVVVLIVSFGLMSYISDKKKDPEMTFSVWFNGNAPTAKAILIGMVSSIVFGFIDNAGLFFGMEALDPVFNKMLGIKEDGKDATIEGFGKPPKGAWGIKDLDIRKNMASGLGNTFSDGVGAFLATFIGRFIQNVSGVDAQVPIWADFVGIVIGCLLGTWIPAKMKQSGIPCK